MTLSYSLRDKDYLQTMLFLASRSQPVARGLRTGKLTLTICFLFFFTLSYLSGADPIATVVLGVFVMVAWVGYPLLHKALYKRVTRKVMKEMYGDQAGRMIQLSVLEDSIVWHDVTGEESIPWTDVESMHELPGYFFLLKKDGTAICIPREATDAAAMRSWLQEIGTRQAVPYIEQLKWKW